MVEVLIILPVAMLLIFGAIQFALIYHAKITLNYAAFEAARYGSLNNARFSSVKEGFTRGLAPLYSYFEADKDRRKKMKGRKVADQVEAFQMARSKIFDEFDDARDLIRIERLSPSEQAFSDYAVDEEIPNDNLMYRASKTGRTSNDTIQDANLLHLRITYWYPLYVPMINRVIFKTICTSKNWRNDPVCHPKSGQPLEPRIPITVVSVMRMQSPAKKSDGFVAVQ